MGKCYLVTGGAGFLGYAVLKHLAKESPEDVIRVKVFDLRIPLELQEVIEAVSAGPKFEWITGDLTDKSQVLDAVQGCDIVLHVASVIPSSSKDDHDTMWKVNVTGSQHIVAACRAYDVEGLVYVSSAATVGPNIRQDPVVNLEEDSLYDHHPRSFYGETKKIAEDYILASNGYERPNGTKLTTCSLRPNIIFGQNFHTLKMIWKLAPMKRILANYSVESKQASIYVGNMAQAIICASKQLEEKSSLVGGIFYFVTDDTPIMPVHRLSVRTMASLGYKLTREPFIPILIFHFITWIIFHINTLLRYLGLSETAIPPTEYIWRANTLFSMSGKKFRKHFNYTPKYTPNETFANIDKYVTRLGETGFEKPFYDFDF